MIILTPEQAEFVRGCAGLNNSRLEPIFYEGRYVLPAAVLNDGDYINQHEYLASLPIENATIQIDE